jgi:hypothetical protein
MAIKCPDCRGLTVNNKATSCFVCGRKFPVANQGSLTLVIMAGLLGVLLTVLVVAAQKLLASR